MYATYKDADNTAREFERRLTVYKQDNVLSTLNALRKAHSALLSDNADTWAEAIQKLKEAGTELQGLGSALAAPAKPSAGPAGTKNTTNKG